ncbi:MAG: hypothetical protein M3Q99_05330 [Acidobacteriota bacterium]|nr:hypothetical protein [Acidobacteriota bacterium]
MSEKDEQIQKFIELCENSSFPHDEELLRGINMGEYLLEGFSNSQVPAKELAGTYKIKAIIAGRNNANHARRLVSDTLSFVDELEKVPNDKVNFWRFSINELSQYTAFEGVDSRKILGCIMTVDKRKVSESEWEKLWNE